MCSIDESVNILTMEQIKLNVLKLIIRGYNIQWHMHLNYMQYTNYTVLKETDRSVVQSEVFC